MIQEFITKVKSVGLARTNRYLVTLGHPSGFVHKATRLSELLCDGAALPGMNVESAPHKIYSESREMPYGVSYNPFTLNFYMDGEMRLKDFFDKWMESIIDPVTREISYYASYTTTINVKLLNLNDETTYEVQLIEAWPKTIGEVSLSYESRDVMRLPVTFQYKNWKRVK